MDICDNAEVLIELERKSCIARESKSSTLLLLVVVIIVMKMTNVSWLDVCSAVLNAEMTTKTDKQRRNGTANEYPNAKDASCCD